MVSFTSTGGKCVALFLASLDDSPIPVELHAFQTERRSYARKRLHQIKSRPFTGLCLKREISRGKLVRRKESWELLTDKIESKFNNKRLQMEMRGSERE